MVCLSDFAKRGNKKKTENVPYVVICYKNELFLECSTVFETLIHLFNLAQKIRVTEWILDMIHFSFQEMQSGIFAKRILTQIWEPVMQQIEMHLDVLVQFLSVLCMFSCLLILCSFCQKWSNLSRLSRMHLCDSNLQCNKTTRTQQPAKTSSCLFSSIFLSRPNVA